MTDGRIPFQVDNTEIDLADNKHPHRKATHRTPKTNKNEFTAPSTSKQLRNKQVIPSTSRTSRSHPDIFELELPEVTRQRRNFKKSEVINHRHNNIDNLKSDPEPSSSSVDSFNTEASTSKSSTSSKHKLKKFRKSSSSPTSYTGESEDQWDTAEKSDTSHRLGKLRIRCVYLFSNYFWFANMFQFA